MLKRSAAVVLVAAGVAGCSSGSMRFTDGLPTASTQPVAQSYPASQPYPGDSALAPANLDRTTTASVNRSAVQPVTESRPRFWQRAFRAPVPQREVGNQPLVASTQSYPAQTYPAAARPAPVAAQPFPAASSGSVARAPVPDPVYAPSSLPPATTSQASVQPTYVDQTSTGSIGLPAPAAAGQNTVTARAGDTISKLANRYGVSADRLAAANGLPRDANLAAGQRLVVPAFGAPAAPAPATAAAPAPVSTAPVAQAPADKVPVPSRKPADHVAVLPQQSRSEPARAAADNKAPSTGALYVVKSGDTLSAIAQRHGTTAAAIRQANGMDSGVIRVGQKLVVPAGAARNVASAPASGVDPIVTGSVASKAPVQGYTPPRKAEMEVGEAARQAAAAPDATGIGRMRWPARGKVVSGFGDTRGPSRNDGIDISVPEGTSVKAAENGVVIYAGDGLKDFGNTVLVRHENGLVTVYGHASQIKVARGETVRRGQEIALSGVSGNASTPKLHFEVRKDSAPVDPSGYLE